MTLINNHIIIYVLANGVIQENHFQYDNNKYIYNIYYLSTNTMRFENFFENDYSSSELNFPCKIGNESKPSNYLEQLFTDKKKYEINQGRIFKLSNPKFSANNDFKFMVGNSYSYGEIKNYFIKLYMDIQMGIFVNDYTNQYSNINVKFVKIQHDEIQ